jgi:hypothetical protein
MADEVTNINEVKKTSDGTVNIAVELYNDLLERANKPPVINRTVVNKTAEMLAAEHRAWGSTFMALGASFFVVGALRYKAGTKQ